MKLHQQLLTNNNCYKEGQKITVKGLLLHSTGVNNPKLSRYIGPDDGIIGTPSPGHWNQPKPGGRSVCVHGFIGKDKNGEIRSYQTLPWDYKGWHAGGAANATHIGIEICEGDLNDAAYFKLVYKEAVELFAHLCKLFNLTEKNIITHSEGHKKGIASNHADVMHWFPKHGKSMDTFRADVKAELSNQAQAAKEAEEAKQPEKVQQTYEQFIEQLAQDTIKGHHGAGDARKKSLGPHFDLVQARVNQILGVSEPAKQPEKSIDELANEVIAGIHGSGDARKKALGSKHDAVQARVNEILSTPKVKKVPEPSVDELAKQVIAGRLGSGNARREALGDRFDEVQERVNQLLVLSDEGKSFDQLVDETIRGLYGSGRERMLALGSRYSAVQAEINRRIRNR